jgi:hypothetical protein
MKPKVVCESIDRVPPGSELARQSQVAVSNAHVVAYRTANPVSCMSVSLILPACTAEQVLNTWSSTLPLWSDWSLFPASCPTVPVFATGGAGKSPFKFKLPCAETRRALSALRSIPVAGSGDGAGERSGDTRGPAAC